VRRLAVALVVVPALSLPVAAQEGNRSLERIGLALQHPPPVLRGVGAQDELRASTLGALGMSVFEPLPGAPKLGPFTLGAPQLQGEVIRLSLPIGEYVSRGVRGIASANRRRRETAARRTVEADLHAFATRQQNPIVIFETDKGTIDVEVDTLRAPVTGANFLKYVDGGFYEGGSVNRAVRPDNTVRHDVEIQVIQFQIDPARRRDQLPPIVLERTSVTGLRHVDGALSMARNGPDTATASFSIVIGDQPEMDFGGRRNPDGQGFAVFGRVVRGMDVVRAIQASPTGSIGPYGSESLAPPIRVLRAYRRKEGP
jgi:peptidyl-prolyl cis-trans isomerase A (cyclophilin A)